MPRFVIEADRRSVALYLAWQFGPGRASQIMLQFPPGPALLTSGSLFGGDLSSRRSAERIAASLSRIVAYQEGRLRRPLTGGSILVRED